MEMQRGTFFLIGHRIGLVSIIGVIIFLYGCSSFVELEDAGSELSTKAVFDNASTANAAITSIYAELIRTRMPLDISVRTGLYADELQAQTSDTYVRAWFQNSLDASRIVPSGFWNNFYKCIYAANAVIEGCDESVMLSETIKKQIVAEAKFIRAYSYFYLVNLYGDVPLITATEYQLASHMGRTSAEEVYDQVVSDLIQAKHNLNAIYVGPDGLSSSLERVRPNQAAASALLARVYLYTKDYSHAEESANFVIEQTNVYDTVALDNVFLKNSKEAIWQIPQSSTWANPNTLEGEDYILIAKPNSYSVSDRLLRAFEPDDQRKDQWIGVYTDQGVEPAADYFYPFKYKIKSGSTAIEYSTALRLGELYLIRAEARAQLGEIDGAQSDLNIIRKRAGLENTEANDKASLLEAILHERQVELFTEWGHRWLDLKRTGKVDEIMRIVTPLKGGVWETYKQLWPIEQTEIDRNPNLKQNIGYDK